MQKKSFLQISTIISKSTIGFLIQSGMAGAGPGFWSKGGWYQFYTHNDTIITKYFNFTQFF